MPIQEKFYVFFLEVGSLLVRPSFYIIGNNIVNIQEFFNVIGQWLCGSKQELVSLLIKIKRTAIELKK